MMYPRYCMDGELRMIVCITVSNLKMYMMIVTAIVETVNTLYRDFDNFSAAGF